MIHFSLSEDEITLQLPNRPRAAYKQGLFWMDFSTPSAHGEVQRYNHFLV